MLLPVMAHLSIKRWTNLKKQDDNVIDREIRGKWSKETVLRFSWDELDDAEPQPSEAFRISKPAPSLYRTTDCFSTHPFPWTLLTLLLPEVWKHIISHPATPTGTEAQRWKGFLLLDSCRPINLNIYFGHTCVLTASWGVGNYSVAWITGDNRSEGNNLVFIYLFIFRKLFWWHGFTGVEY